MNVSSPVHIVGRLLGETAYRSTRSNSLSSGQPFSGRLFDVDPVTGFIPAQPLSRLTGEFSLWEDALGDASRVLKLGEDKGEEAQAKRTAGERWRQQLRTWPVLDVARLGDKRTRWRRAHYVLACLMHYYIHSLPPQPAGTAIIIPKPLAVPMVEVSKKIDMPPILTFADIVLWNWELVNPNEPVSLDNIRFLTLFSGTETERNFYALSLAAELKGAEMVEIFERFMNLPCLTDRTAVATVARDLERIVPIINELSDILQGARSNIDPHIFYWAVRAWWDGSDASRPWVFEGVSPYTSFELGGASAGQSSVMHALDIYLDVDHALKHPRQPSPSPENRRADTRFMEKMRRYMPVEHRAYLTQLQTRSLRDLVQRTPSLRGPYNAAVEALKKFRDGHIRIGTLYIISQARSVPPAFMGGSEAFSRKDERSKGTGGNPVGPLLKAGRDATQRAILKD
ncbi:hypothetical protein BN946_scf185014.g51 [Trametes cinnabarina]|uniref:Indoleamine 2,3-dioxygenase n=1 Tax=Pycnoporus cinnabarinus TaxID=5643 RepID=A0A060SH99_PYCCI|nr:hypothetical protein BN946_scf185014.g51 [Trametes cinnabarina]